MCSWVLIDDQQVYNCTQLKPVACNDEVTGTAFFIQAKPIELLPGTVFLMSEYLYTFVCNYDMHIWLHCIYFLYRHSSTWSSTTYMYTLLLSVKEECCWRYLHGYCTSHPVRVIFENVNGGSSTVSTVSSKIPYQGSSNHFNLFLKVISCQCKLQLYIWVICTSCTMQVLNNFISHCEPHHNVNSRIVKQQYTVFFSKMWI